MCFQHHLQGEGAKTVARALRAAGVRRAYTLSGGFKAWQNAGLGVKQVGRKEGGWLDGITEFAAAAGSDSCRASRSLGPVESRISCAVTDRTTRLPSPCHRPASTMRLRWMLWAMWRRPVSACCTAAGYFGVARSPVRHVPSPSKHVPPPLHPWLFMSRTGYAYLHVSARLLAAVVEKAASQLSGLRQPSTAATVAAVLGGLGFVALNFHTTLQFIGVVSAC